MKTKNLMLLGAVLLTFSGCFNPNAANLDKHYEQCMAELYSKIYNNIKYKLESPNSLLIDDCKSYAQTTNNEYAINAFEEYDKAYVKIKENFKNLYENVIKKYAENFKNNVSVTITNHDKEGMYSRFLDKEYKAGIGFYLQEGIIFKNNHTKEVQRFFLANNFDPLFKATEVKDDESVVPLKNITRINLNSFDEYVEAVKQATLRINSFNFDEYSKFYKDYHIIVYSNEYKGNTQDYGLHKNKVGCCIQYVIDGIDKTYFKIPYEPGKKINLKANRNISNFAISTQEISIPFEVKNNELVVEYDLDKKMSVSAKNISSQDFIKIDAITVYIGDKVQNITDINSELPPQTSKNIGYYDVSSIHYYNNIFSWSYFEAVNDKRLNELMSKSFDFKIIIRYSKNQQQKTLTQTKRITINDYLKQIK